MALEIKTTTADDWFSKCIREAANWTCDRCRRYYPEGRRGGLHCSHFIGRRKRHTRWHPQNAFAHCFGCHQKLGGNPPLFSEWATERLGQDTVENLRRLSESRGKVTKVDEADTARHYRLEHKRLRALRANGMEGRLVIRAPEFWQERAA